jgi:predicted Fe-Mo cluster-binding NifX family protein
MIIALPVDEKSMDARISDNFGRAPFFLICSTVSGEKKFLDHRHVAAQGGSGVRAAQVLADHGVKAVITPQCGVNAEKAFRKAEVLIYQAVPGSIRHNIEALKNDQLHLMVEFKARD